MCDAPRNLIGRYYGFRGLREWRTGRALRRACAIQCAIVAIAWSSAWRRIGSLREIWWQVCGSLQSQ